MVLQFHNTHAKCVTPAHPTSRAVENDRITWMDDDEASWRWIRGGPGEMGLKSNLKGECGQYIYILESCM